MNVLTLVDGRKGDNDTLVLLSCNNEPLTFSELLFILKHYFDSEASYYPTSQGFAGAKYLLEAIHAVYDGASIPEVCRRFKLELKLNVIDERRPRVQRKPERVLTVKSELSELLI